MIILNFLYVICNDFWKYSLSLFRFAKKIVENIFKKRKVRREKKINVTRNLIYRTWEWSFNWEKLLSTMWLNALARESTIIFMTF